MFNQNDNIDVFAAMQMDSPFATYVKTVPSQVDVIILNPFKNNEPQGRVLTGENGSKDSLVQVWTPQEDIFFHRMNARLFEKGLIIKYVPKEENKVDEHPLEQYTDDELDTVVNSKFFVLQNALNKTTSEALIFRLLEAARRNEKSDRIVKVIENRLAEIQSLNIKVEK